jgi:hypothetical protein
MSAADTKTVTFQAKKKKSPAKINPAPNQVSMAGGPGGEDRPANLAVKDGVVVDSGSLATTPLRSNTATDEQFPTAALNKSDPRDALQTAKLELQADPEAAPGMTKFGKLIAKDSDFEWLRAKREQEAEANFQQVRFVSSAPCLTIPSGLLRILTA